ARAGGRRRRPGGVERHARRRAPGAVRDPRLLRRHLERLARAAPAGAGARHREPRVPQGGVLAADSAVTTTCTTQRRRPRAGYLTLPPHPYPGHPIPSTPGEAMDPTARIDAHDRILRGDGNGTPGLVARTSSLERRADSHSQRLDELEGDVEAQERRWQSF